MEKNQKVYLFFASIIFLLFLVLIARFYYLQVSKHDEGLKDAEADKERADEDRIAGNQRHRGKGYKQDTQW